MEDIGTHFATGSKFEAKNQRASGTSIIGCRDAKPKGRDGENPT
jgi:hypothetical protein